MNRQNRGSMLDKTINQYTMPKCEYLFYPVVYFYHNTYSYYNLKGECKRVLIVSV